MPTQPYLLKDGTQVSGVTTIISGNLGWNKEILCRWNYNQAKAGFGYKETVQKAADSGTIVHYLIECYLRNIEPDYTPYKNIAQEEKEIGWHAYQNFLKWVKNFKFEVVELEVPLVSEKYRFGGCIDCVGKIDGKLSLIDWKSSSGMHPDHMIQLMGGYKILWNENNPNNQIEGGYHILRVDKKKKMFGHYGFEEMPEAEEAFLHLLALERLKGFFS